MKIHSIKFNFGQDVIESLIREEIIVGVKKDKGYVVARYGVNKKSLEKIAKEKY